MRMGATFNSHWIRWLRKGVRRNRSRRKGEEAQTDEGKKLDYERRLKVSKKEG